MMEDFGGSGFSGASTVTKKRRSATSRKPRLDSQLFLEGRDPSSPSSTPSSDNSSKQSPDGSSGHDGSVRRKEFSLNSLVPKVSSINRNECVSAPKRIKKDDKLIAEFDERYGNGSSRPGSSGGHDRGLNVLDLRRRGEGVLAPANWRNSSKVREYSDMLSRSPDKHVGRRNGTDGWILGQSGGTSSGLAGNKLRKVKLKVGGVTRTLHAKSNVESGREGGSSAKPPRPSDAPPHRQKFFLQDNSDDGHSPPEKGKGLQGVSWKDFSGESFPHVAKESLRGKATEENVSAKPRDKDHSLLNSEPVRKSKRVPKRRVLDREFGDEDEDAEIRYLEKLKAHKFSEGQDVEHENVGVEGIKKQKSSKASKRASYEEDQDFSLSWRSKEGRKRSRSESQDRDYVGEEEPGSDVGPENERKQQKKESLDALADGRKETSLTTRQRALQSGKDGSGSNGASLIEFPDGLPPAPPRKQKEKLSEVERQLKKAEVAQRRRLQVEKAAKESEAEAIRKILGQDSSRKKRQEKLRKKLDELAQERAAKSLTLTSDTIRWVMGPTGTTVTFSENVGLPSIFNSKPCSYPPPRERCAGPSCTNAYKYRDSKSNLPLCSLQCYRAVQRSVQPPVTTC